MKAIVCSGLAVANEKAVCASMGAISYQPRPGLSVPWHGTIFSACHLFHMKIQQDSYEPDQWWFAPLLYAGVAVLIGALILV
jgi:hypothetical protein